MSKEKILVNGKVYSVKLDGSIDRGEAIAIEDDIIKMVGTEEEVRGSVSADADVIDCEGKSILPGMCDAHCHPAVSAGLFIGCDLFGVYKQENQSSNDIIEIYLERLNEFINAHPDYDMYRGSGWVINNFPGDRLPTRQDLDRICSDKPIVLDSFCIHYSWCNTKALNLAGIDADTPDVNAGKIYRESDGYPTGLFAQPEAYNLIKDNLPGYDFSIEQYKEAFLYYQKEDANRYGVTFVQDCMGSENAREAYYQLAKEGKLTVRLRGVYLVEPKLFKEQLPEYIEHKCKYNVDDDFRIDTIKVFTEGEFVYSQPYEKSFLKENNLPDDFNGKPYFTDDDLTQVLTDAMKAGFSTHLHAMGDASIRQSALCIAKAQKCAGVQNRNTIAHLMLVDDDIARLMGDENIIANVQPRWMVHDSDIHSMLPQIGDRALECYPFRKFKDNNVTVSFGTDYPVTPPPNTMHSLHCAINRSVFPDAPDYEQFKGKVLGSERAATLAEAIKALCIDSAYQLHGEEYAGSIEKGKSADLVILDTDIENIPIDQIYKIKVKKTIFKGEVVFEQ